MKTIKIAHIFSVDFGIFSSLPQLKAMMAEGYEVHAICGGGDMLGPVRKAGIVTHVVDLNRAINPLKDWRVLLNLVKLIKKEGFTIVHTHNAKPEIIGQIAARLAKVPIVLHTHHGLVYRAEMGKLKRKMLIEMARFAGRFSDFYLSQSQEDIDTILDLKLLKPNKIELLGNGIDLNNFNPEDFDDNFRSHKRNEFDINDGHFVVGMVGRYVVEKGYLEYFKAAELVLEKYPKTIFVTVGRKLDSERDPVDISTLERLGIKENFRVLEDRRDMPEIYSFLDAVVLPSFREGVPRALIEAGAMKLPVVATDVPGCREVVRQGENGFLVPLLDVKALAERIIYLIENPIAAKEMGRRGRQIALQKFDYKQVINRVMKTYQKLLQSKCNISVAKTEAS